MADFNALRRSDNIEDRRREVLSLGPFGTPGFPENVFETGHGTMVALDPNKDFVPQPAAPNSLSIDLGVSSIPPTSNTQSPIIGEPQTFLDARQAGQQLSAKDKDLMVRTMLGEAANEGPQGQAAVAHVILNRTAAGSYGKTPTEVMLAPNQFEPWTTRAKELNAIKPSSPAYRDASDIVDMVASGDIPDPTGGATHFLNPAIVKQRRGGSLPDWAQAPIAKIGNHTFYAPEGRVAPDPLDAINRAIAGN